jgi:hypothetical protein
VCLGDDGKAIVLSESVSCSVVVVFGHVRSRKACAGRPDVVAWHSLVKTDLMLQGCYASSWVLLQPPGRFDESTHGTVTQLLNTPWCTAGVSYRCCSNLFWLSMVAQCKHCQNTIMMNCQVCCVRLIGYGPVSHIAWFLSAGQWCLSADCLESVTLTVRFDQVCTQVSSCRSALCEAPHLLGGCDVLVSKF